MLVVASCAKPTPAVFPADLPQREIAFFVNPTQLGFINADGMDYVTRTVQPLPNHWAGDFLTWSPDGHALVARYVSSPPNQGVLLHMTDAGGLLTCELNLAENTPSDEGRAWVISGTTLLTADGWRNNKSVRLVLWDMQTCAEPAPFAGPPNLPAHITGPTLSTQGWLAFTQAAFAGPLVVLDPAGTFSVTVAGGDDPAWSRDGEWLTYRVYKDGLYVMRKDGSEQRKVLDANNPGSPSWSPDGQWLVYDRLKKPGVVSVYKLEVATGQEVEVFEGGIHPAWRWGDEAAP